MIGINIGICMLKTYRTYNPIVEFLKYKFNNKLLGGVTLLNECLNPWHVFMFEFSAFFFSFFPSAWTVTSYGFTMQETKCTVQRSYGTIHTFKNYFDKVFSDFSFSKNKLYPNGPLELY